MHSLLLFMIGFVIVNVDVDCLACEFIMRIKSVTRVVRTPRAILLEPIIDASVSTKCDGDSIGFVIPSARSVEGVPRAGWHFPPNSSVRQSFPFGKKFPVARRVGITFSRKS